MGPFKCYVTQMGWGGVVKISGKMRYKGVRFNVISVTRGCGGPISKKKKALRNTRVVKMTSKIKLRIITIMNKNH